MNGKLLVQLRVIAHTGEEPRVHVYTTVLDRLHGEITHDVVAALSPTKHEEERRLICEAGHSAERDVPLRELAVVKLLVKKKHGQAGTVKRLSFGPVLTLHSAHDGHRRQPESKDIVISRGQPSLEFCAFQVAADLTDDSV